MCMYEYRSLVAGEHVYELAMYLDLLNSSCFPTWHHVFAIAEQVMMTLSLSDPDLYTHLKSIAKTNMQVNKKVRIRYRRELLEACSLHSFHIYSIENGEISYVHDILYC